MVLLGHRSPGKYPIGVVMRKNIAAVELGRRGGKASAEKLTDQQRKEKARRAAQAKWSKKKTDSDDRTSAPRQFLSAQPKNLTEREREIAEYLAQGQSNNYIARRLQIGVNTVKKHVGRALQKFGVSNRTELAIRLNEYRRASVTPAPGSGRDILGSAILEATKEAYQMAEFLLHRSEPTSDLKRNPHG